jgi:hypothetical protein
MTESRFKDHVLYDLEAMTKEDAQKRKEELEAERQKLDGSPATRIAARKEARLRDETRGMSALEKISLRIREFIGRGPAFEYAQQLNEMRATAADAGHVSKNLRELVIEYTTQRKDAQHRLRIFQNLVGCNYVMIQDLNKSKVELETRLESLNGGSVFGATMSEAMQVYNDLNATTEKLIDLNAETNQYTTEVLVAQEELQSLEERSTVIQQQHADFNQQRVRFEATLRTAEMQERIVHGLKGVSGVQDLYERCAILADETRTMGEKVRTPIIEQLPREDLIPPIKTAKPRIAGKEYWQENLERVLPFQYKPRTGDSNGNGSAPHT